MTAPQDYNVWNTLGEVHLARGDAMRAMRMAVLARDLAALPQRPLTTRALADQLRATLADLGYERQDPEVRRTLQRCFQALRIAVNDEFGVLDQFLASLPRALASGGRVAILTFHSGEDRRVKKSFKYYLREGLYREIADEPIRPSAEECHANSRARSAKLRWAIRA